MPEKLVLKFKSSMPLHLEHALVQKFGFTIDSRISGYNVVVSRARPAPHPRQKGTDAIRKAHLLQRCRNISAFYESPKNHAKSVRQRLHNLAQGLPDHEVKIILDYMDKEFPMPTSDIIALPDLR
jgi:hypothetical protein